MQSLLVGVRATPPRSCSLETAPLARKARLVFCSPRSKRERARWCAAHALYLRNGFAWCGPFADYTATQFNVFMVKALATPGSA